ncbi:MAG: hypothetical protein ACQEP8_03520 [Chlamydiota bacterium]
MKRWATLLFSLLFPCLIFAAAIPEWYPKSYNLDYASKIAEELLATQEGEDPQLSEVQRINFSDADHTLLQTTTPLFLKHKKTGTLLTYPDSEELIRIPNNADAEDIKQLYPYVNLEDYVVDYHEMGSIVAIDITPPVQPMLVRLKSAAKKPNSKEYIITARSENTVPPALKDYFSRKGLLIDAVFPVNNEALAQELKYSSLNLSIAQKKALIMAVIIHACPQIKEVSFYDDGDDNLRRAMHLLPLIFPSIHYRFFDVIHTSQGLFKITLVAESDDHGALVTSTGEPFTSEDIENYRSTDHPLPTMITPKNMGE